MKSPFSQLIVPVDGSAPSDRGVRFAIDLVREGGTVTFCSAYDITAACVPAAEGAAIDPGPMIQALEENAELFCRRALDEARAAGVRANRKIVTGGAVSAVLAFAEHDDAEAIVVGTHARTGVARAMLGSVAEGFLRQSSIPVFVVHEDDATADGPIAVAIDGSPPSYAALDLSIELAQASHAKLALLHVAEGPIAGRELPPLEDAEDRLRSLGIDFTTVLGEGRPSAAILEAADRLGCCAIVTGTHARAAVPRFFLGSVANALVEEARIPVVAERQPPRTATARPASSEAQRAAVPTAAP